MCGFLVPGVLLFIAYNIDGGPIITVLKWISWGALLVSTGDAARQRRARAQKAAQKT
jgi:hypothetical protein